jgi:hypothetical protein
MHEPQCRQPVRGGPAPPKYGSATVSPGRPMWTPTGVAWKVCPTPIRSATARIARSAAVSFGYVVTPSIRLAWS